MVPHSQTPTMCTAPESNLGPHCSNVANTAMVPSSIVPVDRLTSPSSPLSGHDPAIPQLPQPTAAAPPQLAAWRVSGNNSLHRKFHQTLSSLSCHPGGRKQTPTTIKISLEKVGTVVSSKSCQSLSASLPDILSFLTKQFQDWKQYRSLNCYRSAISSTHLPIEGFPIGKHPLITRLLIGAFNERPPLTKYASSWEVSTVLTRLSQLGQINPHVECSDKEAYHASGSSFGSQVL